MSEQVLSNLKYQLQGLMLRNQDGSFGVKAERKKVLVQISAQLKQGGYRLQSVQSLKPKHVNYLVERWQGEGLSAGTIKNRLSHVRWWAEKIGKASMLPKSNNGANQAITLDLEKRTYTPTESKAKELEQNKLEKVSDPLVKLSLRLQREFGLRREEAIKFRPNYAIRGEQLVLKPSWTKGGRPRVIPIRTESQRHLLQQVQNQVGGGALIRPDRNYIQQLKAYERQTSQAGLDKNHGLRHMYAQQRYLELTGWRSPIAGGPTNKQLTPEQKQIDRQARLQVSNELGHGREQITVIYLGR
ncbi:MULTISPECIES: phage integrase N-terminal domain-containing protein [Pseudoalteromonas]|uniref:phage integrase N-terminal domain-containing protein n=1 Tax=Pseudoalteromonas TaxID=53246 RepID=UPI0019D1986B|nr:MULTISPECIES: phage integrase N-terminal domain-containing protein [Pseudoalteromonas]MBR8843871.1 integrase domain-containing protein [Pseudoalteromonas sp. JC3]UDM60730.1 integrase domain-containing protein [Pseudoalteromonas piscicida]WJE08130.1 integrase domain-containing protein [Pseudoalteromonas sp. JC3]